MKRDIDLIELLVLWWRYESQWTPVQGYPTECPSTIGYKSSGVNDGDNGAQETDARGQLAQHVGRVVANIAEPYRSALHMVARNRSSGVSVWTSARLPAVRTSGRRWWLRLWNFLRRRCNVVMEKKA